MANLNLTKQNTYPKFSPSDLKDPSLFKLQTSFDFLYSQIEQIQKNSPTSISSDSSSTITGGVAGQVLTSNGAGTATFQALPSADILSATPSSPLTCSTSYADVPGLTVTLDRSGIWVIEVTLDCAIDNVSGAIFGQLLINSIAQPGLLHFASSATSSGQNVTRSWVYTNTGSNVVQMQAKAGFAAGSRTVGQTNTFLIAEFKG